MPVLNWPNRITIARIVLVAPLVICLLYLNSGWPHARRLAFALLVLLALSDALDGYLARRLHEETALGRFLDPVADKLLITCSVILLAIDVTAVAGFKLPHWVPVVAIGKDLIVVLGFCLIKLGVGRLFIQPRIWGKLCTTLQLIMIAFVLLAPDLPSVVQPVWHGLYVGASGMAIVAVVDYVRLGIRFAAEQHAPPPG